MSRVINRLVATSGGWEYFLYQTLKDVCEEVDLTDVNSSTAEAVFYAKDVLEAYEETGAVDTGVDEKKIRPTPVVKTQAQVAVEVQKHSFKLTPTLETKDITDPPKEVRMELAEREIANKQSAVELHNTGVLIDKPEPKPKPQPRMLTAKIAVDNEVGASQGGLPIPFGHVIVNRENLVITTSNGAQLGRGSFDGQIRGSDVSGHIRIDGTYRLVFKDVNCGFGIVKFEVVQNGNKDE